MSAPSDHLSREDGSSKRRSFRASKSSLSFGQVCSKYFPIIASNIIVISSLAQILILVMNQSDCDLPIEFWNWIFLILVILIVLAYLFSMTNKKKNPEKVQKVSTYFTYAPLIFMV